MVLENILGGVAVFNKTFGFVDHVLQVKSKVIVLECLIDPSNLQHEYLKVLYDKNKIGFVCNSLNIWKEVTI